MHASPIVLRAAGPDDARAVLDLSVQSFGHLGDYRAILGGWFAHEAVRTTLAIEPEGAMLGYVMQALLSDDTVGRPVAHLVALAVLPDARRCGIGRRLMACALTLARTDAAQVRGADLIRLEVAEDNPSARALFTSAGFRRDRTHDGRYPNGQRYLGMRRALGPIDGERLDHLPASAP